MSWNPAQQAMLEAMGYTLHRFGARPATPTAVREDHEAFALPGERGGDHARLLLALKRAAGGRELDDVALPPLARLRGAAAAKRALWPRLRALRRS